jgi:hypothetical protein
MAVVLAVTDAAREDRLARRAVIVADRAIA